MKLFIGDIHVKSTDLEECQRLFDFIVETIKTYQVKSVWFLGDQFNDHARVHLDVSRFWIDNLRRLHVPTYLIVGNHDLAPSGAHSMMGFEDLRPNIVIIDSLKEVDGMIAMPYMSKDDFINTVKGPRLPYEKTLVCHATFAGSQYDNGFYAPEGIDANEVPFKYIISGHLHLAHKLVSKTNTVHYLGSPRWLTVSDANQDKFINLLDDQGIFHPISTEDVCKKIILLDITPDTPDIKIEPNKRYHFDLKGPKAWCDSAAKEYGKYGKVRVFPALNKQIKVKESKGILEAFKEFRNNNAPNNSLLDSLIQERIYGCK